jgi:hypothetical protein
MRGHRLKLPCGARGHLYAYAGAIIRSKALPNLKLPLFQFPREISRGSLPTAIVFTSFRSSTTVTAMSSCRPALAWGPFGLNAMPWAAPRLYCAGNECRSRLPPVREHPCQSDNRKELRADKTRRSPPLSRFRFHPAPPSPFHWILYPRGIIQLLRSSSAWVVE